MLGSACFKYFSMNNEFTTFGTSRAHSDIYLHCDSAKDLNSILTENKIDFLINCIGIIKPYIDEQDTKSVTETIRINSLFPLEITLIAKIHNVRIIQIATDCVFSGDKGNYLESDVHDSKDLYGKSKSLGEVKDRVFLNLRTSIIGEEINKTSSLLEWFLNHPKGKISGFSNHYWNGITTYHFALVCAGIILNDYNLSGTQHLVPKNTVTKAELLKIFKQVYNKSEVEISSVLSSNYINRSLSTINEEINLTLWKLAGYTQPPTIEDLIIESKSFYST